MDIGGDVTMVVEVLPDASLLLTRCPRCAQRIAVKRWAHIKPTDTLKKSAEKRICPSCESKWKIVSVPLGKNQNGLEVYNVEFKPLEEF
jgi:hypothetical protein